MRCSLLRQGSPRAAPTRTQIAATSSQLAVTLTQLAVAAWLQFSARGSRGAVWTVRVPPQQKQRGPQQAERGRVAEANAASIIARCLSAGEPVQAVPHLPLCLRPRERVREDVGNR